MGGAREVHGRCMGGAWEVHGRNGCVWEGVSDKNGRESMGV